MKKFATVLVIVVVLFVIVVLLGPFFIVYEGEQAVVTRFGAIVNATTDTGLHFKMPVIDNVVKYPKKILSWDGDAQRIPTKENQFIWVDTTARWKISDPALFYASVTTVNQGYARLDDVVDSSVRTIIAENFLREAVRNSNRIKEITREVMGLEEAEAVETDDSISTEQLRQLTQTTQTYEQVDKGREQLSVEMYDTAQEVLKTYGIELIDIIIRQIRYSEDLTASVYQRMIAERRQIAEAYRSFGEGVKSEWLGRLDNDQRRILSEAYARSEDIRGIADARAVNIYAEAYERDPEFFQFWRTTESYRTVLPNLPKTLTTDMDYFKYLYNMSGE